MASNICTPCGWTSVLISCLSFGSFAVPIKSKRARECNVDPLVFQSYKTFICFISSFLTLPLFKQEFYFTPWGIISGLFWVPAGVAAIYAVQNAGLAVSQGIWSSVIVIVSFVWGIGFFHEQVRSRGMAAFAVLVMILGLWGMSFFSSPEGIEDTQDETSEQGIDSDHFSAMDEDNITIDLTGTGTGHEIGNEITTSSTSLGYEGVDIADEFFDEDPSLENYHHSSIIKRRLGISAAIFNGVWGGSIMVSKSQINCNDTDVLLIKLSCMEIEITCI